MKIKRTKLKLVGLLVGFYGISTFVRYLMLNTLLFKYSVFFKQFNLAWVHNLIIKNISKCQTVLMQPIQFSISIDFLYTQLNVKTVLNQRIQLSVSTVSMSKTLPSKQFSLE